MSGTEFASELCALTIEDIYGELCSRIITTLLRCGRLSIHSLSQHTHLTARQLKNGLAVLIQQNLLFYHSDELTQITSYEANIQPIYFLLRSGKLIDAVQIRYGDDAKELIRELLYLGISRVGDLIEAVDTRRRTNKIQTNGHKNTNGQSNSPLNGTKHANSRYRDLSQAIRQLEQTGLIELVEPSVFLSPSDAYSEIEKELLQGSASAASKGTKQKEELKKQICTRLQEVQKDRERALRKSAFSASSAYQSNQRKPSNAGTNSNGASFDQLEEGGFEHDLVIRVNYEKCNVILRTERLVALVHHDIGPTTSEVYSELLRRLETKVSRCQPLLKINDPDDSDDPDDSNDEAMVTTLELVQSLKQSVDVANGIGGDPKLKDESETIESILSHTYSPPTIRKRRRIVKDDDDSLDEDNAGGQNENLDMHDNISGIDQDSDGFGEDEFDPLPNAKNGNKKPKVTFETDSRLQENRKNRDSQIIRHLHLLQGHSKRFARRCGGDGGGEWTVDFDHIVDNLKATEMDTFITQSFGMKGCRIARILREKGKLDEKQIQKYSLMKQKDIRTKMIEMQMAGFADVQEVPRDANRTSSRTIFLWFFDANRVGSILLDKIYKTMSRAMQLLKAQKTEHETILSLAARSDVKGKEKERLEAPQVEEWESIRETENKVLVQITRLDELVAVFRDF